MAGVKRLSKKERDEQNRVKLLEAATKCDASELQKLVRNSPNLNTRYKKGGTSLMQCAAKGAADCVKILVEAGADVNLKDSSNRTALMFSVLSGSTECVEYLVEGKANINVGDEYEETALIKAVNTKNIQCMDLLLKSGAKVNKVNRFGNSALMIACMYGQTEAVQILIEGANVNAMNKEGFSPLIMAIRKQNLKRVKGYIKDYVTNSESKYDCVKLLLEAGADVNQCVPSTKVMPLTFAIFNRDVNCTKLLLQYKASINVIFFDGLFRSLSYSNELRVDWECIKLFYAAGASVHESVCKFSPYMIQEDYLRLKHKCRESIRTRILKLHSDSNLFIEVDKLPLPSLLKSYLLYSTSLDIDVL